MTCSDLTCSMAEVLSITYAGKPSQIKTSQDDPRQVKQVGQRRSGAKLSIVDWMTGANESHTNK